MEDFLLNLDKSIGKFPNLISISASLATVGATIVALYAATLAKRVQKPRLHCLLVFGSPITFEKAAKSSSTDKSTERTFVMTFRNTGLVPIEITAMSVSFSPAFSRQRRTLRPLGGFDDDGNLTLLPGSGRSIVAFDETFINGLGAAFDLRFMPRIRTANLRFRVSTNNNDVFLVRVDSNVRSQIRYAVETIPA